MNDIENKDKNNEYEWCQYLQIDIETMKFKWEAKWYHYIYYWFYNLWQKYIKRSRKMVYCCKGPAIRKLNAKFTIKCGGCDKTHDIEMECIKYDKS